MAKPQHLAAIGLAGLVLLALPLPTFAQSCALCYTQAASGTARFMAALRGGIVVLVVPARFRSVGMTMLAYRKRNPFKSADEDTEGDRDW